MLTKKSETVDKTTPTTPDTEVCLQPPHDSWQRHNSVWLAHTLEHECECVCVLLADRNLIYSNGGVLGCEAVRCEAPAELSSAGAYNTTVSWGPALMAWGALTAIVPSRPTPPYTYKTPSLHPPPWHLLNLSVRFSLPQITRWDSGQAVHMAYSNGTWGGVGGE